MAVDDASVNMRFSSPVGVTSLVRLLLSQLKLMAGDPILVYRVLIHILVFPQLPSVVVLDMKVSRRVLFHDVRVVRTTPTQRPKVVSASRTCRRRWRFVGAVVKEGGKICFFPRCAHPF